MFFFVLEMMVFVGNAGIPGTVREAAFVSTASSAVFMYDFSPRSIISMVGGVR